jgi:proline iminopeptidase
MVLPASPRPRCHAGGAWLGEGSLIREAKIDKIPGVLACGRLDLGSPPVTAWEPAQAWTGAELRLARQLRRAGG